MGERSSDSSSAMMLTQPTNHSHDLPHVVRQSTDMFINSQHYGITYKKAELSQR